MFYKISIGDLCLQIAATIYYFIIWDFSPPAWDGEVFSDHSPFSALSYKFGHPFRSDICVLLIVLRMCLIAINMIMLYRNIKNIYKKGFNRMCCLELAISVVYILCTSVRIHCTWNSIIWIT